MPRKLGQPEAVEVVELCFERNGTHIKLLLTFLSSSSSPPDPSPSSPAAPPPPPPTWPPSPSPTVIMATRHLTVSGRDRRYKQIGSETGERSGGVPRPAYMVVGRWQLADDSWPVNRITP